MSKIARFKLSEIFQAEDDSLLSTSISSQKKYSTYLPSSFTVLSDQETVVGVLCNSNNLNILNKENLIDPDSPIITYNGNTHNVNAVVVDESSDILMAGEANKGQGKVVQYKLSNGEILHNYESLEIGKVLCGTRFCNLYFFGGISGNFRIIDANLKSTILDPVETCIGDIYDLEVCPVEGDDPKLFVTVDGRDQNNEEETGNKTDCFDVTNLVEVIECGKEGGFVQKVMQKQIEESGEFIDRLEEKLNELENNKKELVQLIQDQQKNLEVQEKRNRQLVDEKEHLEQEFEMKIMVLNEKQKNSENAFVEQKKVFKKKLSSKETEITLIKNEYEGLVDKLKQVDKFLKEEQNKVAELKKANTRALTHLESEKEINTKTLIKLTEEFKNKENNLIKSIEQLEEDNRVVFKENQTLKKEIINLREIVDFEKEKGRQSTENQKLIQRLEFENKLLESKLKGANEELNRHLQKQMESLEIKLSFEQMKKDNQYLIKAFEESEKNILIEKQRNRELQSKKDLDLKEREIKIVKLETKLEHFNELWQKEKSQDFERSFLNNELIEELRKDNLNILKVLTRLDRENKACDEPEPHIWRPQIKGGISNALMIRIDYLFDLYSDLWRKMECRDELNKSDTLNVKRILRKIYELSLDPYGFGKLK